MDSKIEERIRLAQLDLHEREGKLDRALARPASEATDLVVEASRMLVSAACLRLRKALDDAKDANSAAPAGALTMAADVFRDTVAISEAAMANSGVAIPQVMVETPDARSTAGQVAMSSLNAPEGCPVSRDWHQGIVRDGGATVKLSELPGHDLSIPVRELDPADIKRMVSPLGLPASVVLESAADAFAHSTAGDCSERHAAFRWAKAHLQDAALAFAASAGNLDAAERAELHALRTFRDGVVSLREEAVAGKGLFGEEFTPELVVETIDALLALAIVPIGAQAGGR